MNPLELSKQIPIEAIESSQNDGDKIWEVPFERRAPAI
jgi:hypothetical protein